MSKKVAMVKDSQVNTTLIIGNGFDRNLGMRTGYDEFFNKLKTQGFFAKNAENPLLAFIYEKGANENWYAFEDIIKEFSLYGEQSQTLVYCTKLLDNLDKIQHFDDNALACISNFKELIVVSKTLGELLKICKNFKYANLELQNSIRQGCVTIRKEVESYATKIREECELAIEILTNELILFIKEAKPKIEYSASSKLICALIGCDGKGFIDWADNILRKYNKDKDTYFFPEFNIVSFNYTDSLHLVTQVIEMSTGNALCCNSKSFSEKIYNIHGTLDTCIAFGTDENNCIPKELWGLRKCSVIQENAKRKFHKILCNSKRIVIFGHSIQGIDFEYYEEYFKNLKSAI